MEIFTEMCFMANIECEQDHHSIIGTGEEFYDTPFFCSFFFFYFPLQEKQNKAKQFKLISYVGRKMESSFEPFHKSIKEKFQHICVKQFTDTVEVQM